MRLVRSGIIVGAIGVVLAAHYAALAGIPKRPVKVNERQAYLVRQDQSDCKNGNVPLGDSSNVVGNLWLTRNQNGTTSVKVAITASPKTTYHFNLKCVRQLTDITTDDEGEAIVTTSFQTNETGAVYGFDMAPQGATTGNVFQSEQVDFQ